jgi:ABC-2 type transport system permease protein
MIALVRTEFTKAARRMRTLVIVVLLVGLPTLITVAIHARANRVERGDSGEGLFRLAQQSGLLVPAAVLSVMSSFLLVVIAGTLAGDAVAGDASWGNLRYLLMRPVRRGRLLVAKAIVAGSLIWAATFLVVAAGLVVGIAFFGAHSVTVPGVGTVAAAPRFGTVPSAPAIANVVPSSLFGAIHLDGGALLLRVAIATGYVAFGYMALLAVGMLFSTLTDTSTSAIGATVGVYIVSEILDSIEQLGTIRYAFPTHYLSAWQSMFTDNTFSHDMIAGVVVQIAYLAVFGTAAIIWFQRKDIRS